MTDIAIVGASGHGRTVLANFIDRDEQMATSSLMRNRYVFLDDEKTGCIDGVNVVGLTTLLSSSDFLKKWDVIIGIGDPEIRGRLSRRVLELGGRLAYSIHPSAVICQDTEIGAGTFIGPQALIGAGSRIGRYCVVNNLTSIGHFATLHDGCSVNDGSHFAGAVTIGEEAYLGIGVLCLPNVTIGARAMVGAGTVVRKDVPPDVTVVSPSEQRIIRHRGTHG